MTDDHLKSLAKGISNQTDLRLFDLTLSFPPYLHLQLILKAGVNVSNTGLIPIINSLSQKTKLHQFRLCFGVT